MAKRPESANTTITIQPTLHRVAQPDWLPKKIPELDGLRGIAVLAVFLHHCQPRLAGTLLMRPAQWGWSGVNLFFVLSGYLITAILLRARSNPDGYFRNFYARRALRVLPLYALILAVCFLGPSGLHDPLLPGISHGVTILSLCLFLQNLFHTSIAGALQPTWSLAIEEQFYWLWAPIVRFIPSPKILATGLVAVLALSPVIRGTIGHRLNPQHTLLHLDAIAIGSLLAIGILTARITRRHWLIAGGAAITISAAAITLAHRAPALLDSFIALGFAGVVLLALAGSGARNPAAQSLRGGPLPWLGRISYGFYLTHMPVIIWIGGFDIFIDHTAIAGFRTANLLIVVVRFFVCLAVATILWHGFEKPILRLKRLFPQHEAFTHAG
ncbi:acyltransferase family protein [Silvibacterium sp.]|uniref:acyltransferase family protein n=1 Tax=Silvibacterium sp. TaxID=1964179 RepID=UPI0039E6F469